MSANVKHQNITVCYHSEHAEVIKAAALKQKATLADYIRSRLLPLAAKDAGVELPTVEPFGQRGRRSVVAQAARMLGVPVAEFRRRIAEDSAKAILEKRPRGARRDH